MTGLMGIGLLLLLMLLLDFPVAYAMFLSGFIGMCFIIPLDSALTVVFREIWEGFSSYGLTVIPLFLLMGNVAFYSGISQRLFESANVWFGGRKGGLCVATILACAGFAAICGSNAATAAAMSRMILPEMKKHDYNPVFATGSVACGSTLGVVIPPSVVLVVYGLYVGQSVAKLFIASIIPGLILTGFLILALYFASLISKSPISRGLEITEKQVSLLEKLKKSQGVVEALILFLFVMIGLYMGWFTPTEGGAAGAFGAIVLGLIRRTFKWNELKMATLDTLKGSCMVLMLVIGATVFGRFLTMTRIPYFVADYVSELALPSWAILGMILIVYIIGGALMDALAFLLITLPVFYPLVTSLGYDPIWYGVVITIVTTMGAVTPPVGINAYIVAGFSESLGLGGLRVVFRGVIGFLPAYIFTVILLIIWPEIGLWLTKYMKI